MNVIQHILRKIPQIGNSVVKSDISSCNLLEDVTKRLSSLTMQGMYLEFFVTLNRTDKTSELTVDF